LAAVLAGVGVAWVLPNHPFLATGAVLGGVVLLALVLRPLELLGVMLAVGAVNLAWVTGGQRELLSGMGGLDMNGIRLMGFVAGFAGLLLIDRRMQAQAFGRYGRVYLLFLAYAAGTLAFSPEPLDGTRLLFKLAFPFLVFIGVAALVRSLDDLDRLGRWTLVAATVFVLLINPLLVLAGGYTVDNSGHLRIQGLGMHQNPFSQYLLAMAFLALARYTFRGQLRYLALAVVLAGWIVLTMSRIMLAGSLVGLAAMAVYGSVLRRNLRPVVAATVMGLAVAIPLTPLVLDRTLGFVPGVGEMWVLLSDPATLVRSMSWSGRDQIWPVLVSAFLDSPVVGLGAGASGPVLRSSFSSAMTDVPHNEYLRILVDTGVVGLILVMAGVAVWWVASARAGIRARGALTREYALAAVAIIPAGAVVAFTGNSIDYYSQFTQFIAFFCAAAITAAALEPGEVQAAEGREE
ncbi:MAG TPA: O-antigen ligase family protein, partial [Longimicrobiales bacterium]|nr:O-antigen ligase family protein [Longimicrobiales bacterium]